MQCVDLQAGTAHQNKHLGYGLTAHFAMNRWPVSWAHSSTDKRSSKATRTGWRRDGDGGGGHRWRWPPIRCDPARNSASTRCFWLDRWMDGWMDRRRGKASAHPARGSSQIFPLLLSSFDPPWSAISGSPPALPPSRFSFPPIDRSIDQACGFSKKEREREGAKERRKREAESLLAFVFCHILP